MSNNETLPLPNATDAMKLKALIPTFVDACPDAHEMAHEVAREILAKHGIKNIDPDAVYWHRFYYSASSSKTFSGWEHSVKPHESMSLPQLVLQRFHVHDQDNADLLDGDGGFYSVGPDAPIYNETNEVRLHASDVLKDFWTIDFGNLYKEKVASFWKNHAKDFRALAKCNFLAKALDDRESKRLSDENFKTVIKAAAGNASWPVTLEMLYAEAPRESELRTGRFDIARHCSSDIFRILDRQGRQILYVPNELHGFHVFQTPKDLHWWVMMQAKDPSGREQFLTHFDQVGQVDHALSPWLESANELFMHPIPLDLLKKSHKQALQNDEVGLNQTLDLLYTTWGKSDDRLNMLDQFESPLWLDPFTWLSESKSRQMASEADALITNGDLREKLWIGYLSTFGRLAGAVAPMSWPIALAAVGAGIASTGLNIDQAINGKSPADRKAGIIGAIRSVIDTLFNATLLKGGAKLPEIAEANEFIAPEEKLAEKAASSVAVSSLEEIAPGRVYPVEGSNFLAPFETNELLDGYTPISTEGKFRGIIQPETGGNYILMNDGYFAVRYANEMKTWFIIDPANPYSFYRNVPVRLNAAGDWEPIKLKLAGGAPETIGKIFGKKPWGRATHSTPNIENPATAYDVPPQLRPKLKAAAAGHDDRALMDMVDSLLEVDPYRDFKAIRKRLYEDASKFYESPELPSRPPIPDLGPAATAQDLIRTAFDDARGLVIGESHTAIGSKQFLIDNMELLARKNVKTLYMEHLLTDFHQADLDAFAKTGTMSQDLESYLKQLDAGHLTDPLGQYTFLELVKEANRNHIRIQAIDCMASYRVEGMEPFTAEGNRILDNTSRQKMMNFFAREVIRADQATRGAHTWVALVGNTHANTFEGVAGVSELDEAIGLRVEDVGEGHSAGIQVDPGRAVSESGADTSVLIKSDLLLQVETPWAAQSSQTFEELLPRAGMFTVKQEPGGLVLVHRSKDNSIVRTAIQNYGGHFYIERPAWLSINRKAFVNLKELAKALSRMGMKLAGWSKPL
jgi:hypothetical protein